MLLSLDISTSCVGLSVFNENGNLIELNYVKFNSKNNIFEKFKVFQKKTEYLTKFPIHKLAIEKPLDKFQGKFSSAHTIAILNFFNGMLSGYLTTMFEIEPIYYNVKVARTTALPNLKIKRNGASTKHQVWEEVVKLEPQINWKYGTRTRKLVEENYDMVDAYVVGKCHLKMLEIQKKKLDLEKT